MSKNKVVKNSSMATVISFVAIAFFFGLMIGVVAISQFALQQNADSKAHANEISPNVAWNSNPDSVTWDANFWAGANPAAVHTTYIVADPMHVNFAFSNNNPPPPLPSPVPANYYDEVYGNMNFTTAGEYAVSATHDNGLRVTFDGQVVMDHYNSPQPATDNFKVNVMSVGTHTVKYEHNQTGGSSNFLANWSYVGPLPTPVNQ